MQNIEIFGANTHNLKNLNLIIPKKQLVCITGVSGSGKSTLAFDTLFMEGQRKYLESLSIYARQFIKPLKKPDVQSIRGISPTISIDQKHSSFFYNSTVGTISEVSQYLRLLYARLGEAHCPQCGRTLRSYSSGTVTDYIFREFGEKLVFIYAPIVKNRKGTYKALLEKYLKRGFLKAMIDKTIYYLDDLPKLDRNTPHNISILIDAIRISSGNRKQADESIALALFESGGEIILVNDNNEYFFSNKLYCMHCNISIQEPQPATFSINSPIAVCSYCNGRGETEPGHPCSFCKGSGFNTWALSFYFRGKTIHDLGEIEIHDLLAFFNNLRIDESEKPILEPILPQIIQRLDSFVKLNLGYITLNRKINTLSGGELQRTRLVSQIGFRLSGIIYILDEPSIGLHITEQENLLYILRELKENDNSVILVEHDGFTIRSSDYIVDLGPGAGEKGGYLTYCGWNKYFHDAEHSLTAEYIFNRKQVQVEKVYQNTGMQKESDFLEFTGISVNNISNAHIQVPLKSLTVVTGVSGSGKSSLILDGIYPILIEKLENKTVSNGKRLVYKECKGTEYIGRVMMVTQSAIGKNSRSCPATYIGLMPFIRDLFAGLTEAKMRGYESRRFSFNTSGGRCEACKGTGTKKLEMSFLPELEIPCPICDGTRYNSETLQIKYDGLSITDILNLTAAEAYELFKNIPFLAKKLKILNDVGLGYLRLGQSTVTLSGGESQRIKLTRELSRSSSKSSLYIFDEPTIGLHFDDIKRLMDVFFGLIAKGNTIIVIEHNLEVIRLADYIIDLGPGGGKNGGLVLYQGNIQGISLVKDSKTGHYF